MAEPSKPIVEGLWNESITPATYGNDGQYYDHLLEQYKLYVEMANQISERRDRTNAFFLSLNTLIFVIVGFGYENIQRIEPKWVIVFPLLAIIAMCFVWGRLLTSYRQLNSGKYKVIGEFESHLPVSPYWSAEWNVLGKGEKPNLYTPLTHVEIWIPIIFGILYAVLGGIAMLCYTA